MHLSCFKVLKPFFWGEETTKDTGMLEVSGSSCLGIPGLFEMLVSIVLNIQPYSEHSQS